MFLDKGHAQKYLEDWQDGKIQQGLGIGDSVADQYLRHKQGQMNFIMGLDNVGKTHFELWYFLVLAVHHNITFDIWTGENNPSQNVKKLIEMLAGEKIDNMQKHKLYNYHDQIDMWFNFISTNQMYRQEELLDLFGETDSLVGVIDPFTGLKRDYQHQDNYEYNHKAREFVNKTNKTLYTSLHPRTEAGNREFPKGHDLEGYIKPPYKSFAEGGQVFPNRADDFYVIHRHVQHPVYRFTTELHIQKVKDTDTGGTTTLSTEPLMFDYNYGLGFTIGGYNPLKNKPQPKQMKMKPNKEFEPNKHIEPKQKIETEDWLNYKDEWNI